MKRSERFLWVCAAFTVCALTLTRLLPLPLVAFYVVMSGITFGMYGIDKAAAVKDRWRTPERFLHLLDFAGGWPGGLLGQRVLRHKVRKLSFQIVFWLTVALNCVLVAWLLTYYAPASLQR